VSVAAGTSLRASEPGVARRRCVALAVALLLAACGGPEAPTQGSPDKPLTSVGISVASLHNPYFAAIARGAEAEARRINPTAQVTTVGDDYSAFKQADEIDAFVAAHADLILLTPADPDQISDAIGRARAAGIVVVAIDAPAAGADADIANDNVEAGALACRALAQAIGGHGQVAILGGPASPTTTARGLGCADALSRLPDIRVVAFGNNGAAPQDGSRENAQRTMRGIYGAAGQVDGVFAISDAEALGAADAVAALGHGTLIASAEGSPAIEAALASRARPNVVATAALDPFAMGGSAVRVGNDIRNGRQPKPEERLLDPALVTRDSVRDYRGWLAGRE
jgi:ribose transport system substrate-binding protein